MLGSRWPLDCNMSYWLYSHFLCLEKVSEVAHSSRSSTTLGRCIIYDVVVIPCHCCLSDSIKIHFVTSLMLVLETLEYCRQSLYILTKQFMFLQKNGLTSFYWSGQHTSSTLSQLFGGVSDLCLFCVCVEHTPFLSVVGSKHGKITYPFPESSICFYCEFIPQSRDVILFYLLLLVVSWADWSGIRNYRDMNFFPTNFF